ncbi:MAG: hypothetical protein Q7T45_14665 [Bradyrhizobium sp.]|uniref:hypothetical protein n=1 Tax=Bradyrhizobium sp. TaxID=376 RepID=UPI002720211D|nr:hypothetical protein [Bradyrhizobium sp.]MDO8399054.1 hypothetical protein [Bradyrhizobium sp.]
MIVAEEQVWFDQAARPTLVNRPGPDHRVRREHLRAALPLREPLALQGLPFTSRMKQRRQFCFQSLDDKAVNQSRQ